MSQLDNELHQLKYYIYKLHSFKTLAYKTAKTTKVDHNLRRLSSIFESRVMT